MNCKNNRHGISKLEYNNRVITAPKDIVDAFGQYFSTIGATLDSNIPRSNLSPLDYLGTALDNSIFIAPCSAEEVTSIILSFSSKGCNVKTIPVYIYKSLVDILSPVVAHLFNASVSSGLFPEALKTASVVPLYKSGSRQDIANYRPISTLPVISKIFEKLMCKRIIAFMTEDNIICNHQFGFQKGRNTSDAILEFLDYVYSSLNDGKIITPIYLDFS